MATMSMMMQQLLLAVMAGYVAMLRRLVAQGGCE